MEFKFNFLPDSSGDETSDDKSISITALSSSSNNEEETKPTSPPSPFREIFIAEADHQVIHCTENGPKRSVLSVGKYAIHHLVATEVEQALLLADSPVAQSLKRNSDITPNVYEGGLKVWECSQDLAFFLNSDPQINLKGKSVFEIGCGAGLPGILALLQGASVDFQDFNAEVIQHLTIPNVLLNVDSTTAKTRCRFLAGDWESVAQHVTDMNKYDVILTSETIYNPANYGKLLNLMEKTLSSCGTVYVAAKSYYFGVGGSTEEFQAYVRQHGLFNIALLHSTNEGVRREILAMKFKDQKITRKHVTCDKINEECK